MKLKSIKDIKISEKTTIKELANQMKESGGFQASLLGQGVEILREMFKNKECINFLSFPACIIATGTRGIIVELIKRKLVDVIITTNGTLDHDLARIWQDYYHGSFQMEDVELHKKGINRLGNILIPNESYGLILEEKLKPILEKIYAEKKELSTKDLIWKLGEAISKEKNAEQSIIYWCWKNRIPMFIPGPLDGAVGSQLWLFWQDHKDFKLNLFEDEQELSNIVFEAKKTGALVIGGGISKHHTIWWNQFKGGLDYAVYITTATEFDGSLSGARTSEAVSWGKIKEKAKHITIHADATLILPLMIAALSDNVR